MDTILLAVPFRGKSLIIDFINVRSQWIKQYKYVDYIFTHIKGVGHCCAIIVGTHALVSEPSPEYPKGTPLELGC